MKWKYTYETNNYDDCFWWCVSFCSTQDSPLSEFAYFCVTFEFNSYYFPTTWLAFRHCLIICLHHYTQNRLRNDTLLKTSEFWFAFTVDTKKQFIFVLFYVFRKFRASRVNLQDLKCEINLGFSLFKVSIKTNWCKFWHVRCNFFGICGKGRKGCMIIGKISYLLTFFSSSICLISTVFLHEILKKLQTNILKLYVTKLLLSVYFEFELSSK